MKTSFLLGALLLSTGSFLLSSPVSSNVSDSRGYADSSVNRTLSGNSVQLQAIGSASYGATRFDDPFGEINGSQSFSQALTTAGPVRSGLIQVTLSATGGNNNGNIVGNVMMPTTLNGLSLNASCSSNSTSACFGNTPGYFVHEVGLAPFQLGQQFTLGYSETGYAYYANLQGGYASFAMNYGFQLFEADGTTGVAVESATPEPATWSLLGLSFSVVAFLKRRKV